MTANLPEKWSINLGPKNGTWQFYIYYYELNGVRRQKWVDTHLKLRGNKRNAETLEQAVLDEWVPKLMKKVGLGASEDQKLQNSPDSRKLSVQQDIIIPEHDRVLFTDYLESWLVVNRIRYQVTTYAEYCRVFDVTIIPYFEPLGLYLDELKVKHIQNFYDHMIKSVSGNTVLRLHSYLHKALQDAVDDDDDYPYFQINPASKTKRPQHKRFIPTIYTAEDMGKLFTIIGQDFLFLIILMDAQYAMRRSELMGLTWSAIDFHRKMFTVKRAAVRCKVEGKYVTYIKDVLKNDSSYRAFEITPEIEAVLLAEKARQKANRKKYGDNYNLDYADYVFVDDMGNLRDPNYVSDHFRRTLKKHDLKVIRFHDLRHTCATMLLDGGLSLKKIQMYLGHSQLATTADLYTHLDYTHQQESSQLAGQILNQIRGLPTTNTEQAVQN